MVDREEDGISKRVVEDVSHGWFPTNEEHGLPANNPSIIAHYLNKGIRVVPLKVGRVTLLTVLNIRRIWNQSLLKKYRNWHWNILTSALFTIVVFPVIRVRGDINALNSAKVARRNILLRNK